MCAKLGQPKETAPRKGEYGFACPGKPGSGGCSSAPQGKVRLWVNPANDQFNCWHCGFKGSSLGILMVRGSADWREYTEARSNLPQVEKEEVPPCTTLPVGFKPFRLRGDSAEAPYLSYLRSRNITDRTVQLYRMGYVEEGRYRGRVVVPSFDRFGMINLWSARSIYPTETKFRYMLPLASKDMVSNEHLVDWTRPVYIVEGIFDEIALGEQAISLYGKFMHGLLALRLVTHRPPLVYVCLDSDAWEDAEQLAVRLMGYDLNCALVELDGKDPSVIGRIGVESMAGQSMTMTGSIEMLREKARRM